MKAAGLTHGAFYGYFASKDELIGQACAHGLANTDESWKASANPLKALAELYLADDHCENVAEGCLFAALGSEVARQNADARGALTEALRVRIAALSDRLPSASSSAKRERAIATWAGLIGTLALARAVDDPGLTEEILSAGKAVFGGKRTTTAGTSPARKRKSKRRSAPAR